MSSIFDGEDTIPGVIWIITSIGSLNWGLLEFMQLDLVEELELMTGSPIVATVLYGVIAVAGTITLLDHLGLYDVTDVVDDLLGDGDNSRGQLDLSFASGRSSQAKTVLAGVLLIGTIVGLAAIVPAAGLAGDGTEFANESVAINNTTDTVYADLTDTSNGPVNVSIYGYNATDDAYTAAIENESVDSPNSTTRVDWVVEQDLYDSYRVIVAEDVNNTDIQDVGTIEIGKTEIGGSGVFSGANGERNSIIALVVVVGGFLIMKGD